MTQENLSEILLKISKILNEELHVEDSRAYYTNHKVGGKKRAYTKIKKLLYKELLNQDHVSTTNTR